MTHALSSARIGELYSETDRFFDFAGLKNDPAPVRGNPDYRDPPAPNYPLSAKAKAALTRINNRAFFNDFFDEKPEVAKFSSFPREPGKAPPPGDRQIWDGAKAEFNRLNLIHVAALEKALTNAKERSL